MPPPTSSSVPIINLARRSAVVLAASSASTTTNDGGGDDQGDADPQPKRTTATSSSSTKFHPSIFRYTCRGRLTLNSHTRDHHAGICHGIKTQLEHVDHWKLTTEDEAVQWFQTKAAWSDASSSSSTSSSTTARGPNASAGSASGGSVDPSLPPPGAGSTAHAIRTAHMSNVLVYPSTEQSTNNNHPPRRTTTTTMIRPPVGKEEWSCYGTTEVDLLVLRPQNSKNETIAAVAPYCAPGMAIRDVHLMDTDNTKERTSTIRLGILEILYQSTMEDDEDDDLQEEDMDEEPLPATAATQDTKSKDPKEETTSTTLTQSGKPKRRKKRLDEDEDEAAARPNLPTRFYNSSQIVAKQMQMNAQLIYQATQDDFMGRTIQASRRIVAEFPRQLDRTLDLMWRVLTWDWPPPPSFGDGDNGGPPPPAM